VRNRSVAVVGALALLLSVAGCNNAAPQQGATAASPGAVGTSPDGSSTGGDKKLTIAVIPKGTTHSFWKSVEAGAKAAAEETGAEIIWKGPLRENDRAQQIAIVQQFVSDNVSGIALAPLDDAALVSPVRSANAKDIPVLIFDSALKGTPGKEFVSFVATDNRKGGGLGGERLAKLLGGKGKVILLRYQEGSASTQEREAGFLDVMKKTPGIQVIVDNRYAGATVGDAKAAAMNMVDRLKEADGIFCPNESSTVGMLLALRQNNLAGKVKFVGFDVTEQLTEALDRGDVDALVAQNPTKMGYESVKLMVARLKGEKIEERVDTGVVVIDKENLKTPDVQKLVGGG